MDPNETRLRLDSGDRRFLLLCVLALLVFGAITALLFPRAFPEASLAFRADRGDARRIAQQYLAARGISVHGDMFAGIFDADEEQRVYLERTLGLEKANELYSGEARLWRWQLRWFEPLRKDEVGVAVTPDGEVVGFRLEVPEDRPGSHLPPERARGIAEEFLTSDTRFRPGDLTFVEASAEERPARRDHSFVWELNSWNVGESTFRVQVDVLGDRVGTFRQFVRVPENWSRDYTTLRSRNETAGAVATFLYVLTGLGALLYFVRFVRLADVPWSVIGAFAAIGGVLTFLNELNGIPLALFDYDTTQSFASFLGLMLLSAFVSAVFAGFWIGLFGAAGEPLYRRHLPRVPSLAGTFSWQGFESKSVFRGIVLGFALTAFFMAYQAVFYVVAARFGAWAPAEIPYSNLLNTYFPWIAVLLIGFLPAVSEEFSNRMFSIPFYERLLKHRVLAVVLAGFVWGFLHAGYPNQPFYIRGLEVGLAGVMMGFLMLRFGIFPLLVWHYTVDAIYSAFLLLRSGNLYFVISGAACAFILLVPLAIALVLYFRKGGFRPEADLLNEAVGFEPESADPETSDEAAGSPPPVPVRRIPRTLVVAALLSLAISAVFLLLPTRYPPRDLTYPMTRDEALVAARDFVRGHGSDPDSYRVVTSPDPAFDSFTPDAINLPPWSPDPVATRYVTEFGGLEAWKRLVGAPVPASLWTTRFVRPLVLDEWYVAVDPRTRRIAAFAHDVAREAPGADLTEAAARERVAALLDSARIGPTGGWTPVAATSQKEKNRRDWTFVYADSGSAVALAVPRLTVRLAGDRPAGSGVTLHVPENYVRSRTRSTPLSTLLMIVRVIVLGGLVGMIVAAVFGYIRKENVPWKGLFRIVLFLALPVTLAQLNQYPALIQNYQSEIPWNVFLVTGVVGLALGVILQLALILGTLLVIEASRPAWRGELHPRAWPAQAGHALVVVVLALALGVWVDRLELLARIEWPHLFAGPTPPGLPGYETLLPFLDVVWTAVTGSFLIAALIAGVAILLRGPFATRGRRWAAGLLVAVALGPDHVHSAAEAIVPTLFEVLALAAAIVVAVKAVRGNVLAYLVVLPLALGGQAALVLVRQPQGHAIVQGLAALVLLSLPLLAVVTALFAGDRTARSGKT